MLSFRGNGFVIYIKAKAADIAINNLVGNFADELTGGDINTKTIDIVINKLAGDNINMVAAANWEPPQSVQVTIRPPLSP